MSLFYFLIIIAVLFALRLIILLIFFKSEIKAACERDPAAYSFFEVVLLYQGVHAIFYHRAAHFLYKMKLEFNRIK